MLLPKKVKHRKCHKPRGRNKGKATSNNKLEFGQFGFKSKDHSRINSRQIEAARKVITRYVEKGGQMWTRIFPDRPVTEKGDEMPMGGGKGEPSYYACNVKPGTILFEIGGMEKERAKEALTEAGYKLPIQGEFVSKEDFLI
ncbi:MAG: 50S ribosomal protein L16 [Candidatus Magasanikbacteria bacterium]